ncbi:3187_t:CDS:2, partial [Acaulospora colombiana]
YNEPIGPQSNHLLKPRVGVRVIEIDPARLAGEKQRPNAVLFWRCNRPDMHGPGNESIIADHQYADELPILSQDRLESRLRAVNILARISPDLESSSALGSRRCGGQSDRIEHLGTVTAIDELDASESGGVTQFDPTSFKVGLAPETLSRTNLGQLKVGQKVNLERAVAGHIRFGGHFVQPDGNSLRLLFKVPEGTDERPSLLPYIIPKGFIALDGTSLTVTTVSDADRTFGVMLIAHTQTKIDLSNKPVGATVNVEVDMVGKYVEKSVTAAMGDLESDGSAPLKAFIEKTVEN